MINAGCGNQLAEVVRISPRVRALIDSERSQPGEPLGPDRQGFVDVCAQLKIPCCVLERRAIENYLVDHAIKTIKNSDKFRALGHFELLKDSNPCWAKDENWRIARSMTKADLDGTDLGKFLESL